MLKKPTLIKIFSPILKILILFIFAGCSFKNKETLSIPSASSTTDETSNSTTTTTTTTSTSSTTTTTVPITGPIPAQNALSVSIIAPSTTFSNPFYTGTSAMPTIRISGVNAGNRVRLYVWAIPGTYTCVTNSGEAVSSSSSVDIIISPGLTSGDYLFTAIVDDGAGNNTGCPSVASYPSIPNVLYRYSGPPAAPTALTLITPASSPGRQSLITIRASGVTNGSTVRLFTDSNCSTQIASAAATGTTVNITTTTDLASGSYTFYSNRTVSGLTSPCSTATVTYQRNTVLTTPSTVARTSPASSPGIDPWPVITIGGVTSGDTVNLYSDSSCTTLLGSNVASSTTIDLSPDNALSDGTYNFYAKSTYVNTNANASTTTLSSSCSSAHAQYVLDTLISSPTGLTVTSPTVTPSPSVTPIIRVSGVSNGDTVYLFTDSSCTSQIASATSTGTSVDIVTSIPAGDAVWDFYATRINGT